MPITVAKIASNTASTSFQWGEDTVNITYYPGLVTEKTFADLDSFNAASSDEIQSSFAMLNTTLCKLMKSWDVLEEDGSMFPLEPGRMAELPILFRAQCITAITGDVRPETAAPQKS